MEDKYKFDIDREKENEEACLLDKLINSRTDKEWDEAIFKSSKELTKDELERIQYNARDVILKKYMQNDVERIMYETDVLSFAVKNRYIYDVNDWNKISQGRKDLIKFQYKKYQAGE